MKFFNISNRPEIPLMSILKLFFDTFVSFLRREVIIISLSNEDILVLDLQSDDNSEKKKCISEKEKMENSELVKAVQ